MPNVEFVADGSKGYSSDLVSLVVRSHNGRGIARHQALTANYGVSYDFAAADAFLDENGERSKKFRGALDAVFAAAAAAKADSPQKPQTQTPKPGDVQKPDVKPFEKPETPEKPQKPEKPTVKPEEKPEEKPTVKPEVNKATVALQDGEARVPETTCFLDFVWRSVALCVLRVA